MLRKLENIYDFFRYDLTYGVRNLITWFPIIWKHRNWDYTYTLIVLRKSLTDLRNVIKENNRHLNAPKDVKRMTVCVNLLDRIIGEATCGEYSDFDYHNNVFKHHDRKWGELRTWFEPYDENGSCLFQSHRPNITSKKEEEQETKEYRKLVDHQKMLEQQDIDMLFDTLKRCREWWD